MRSLREELPAAALARRRRRALLQETHERAQPPRAHRVDHLLGRQAVHRGVAVQVTF
jgi:hypothetical protein